MIYKLTKIDGLSALNEITYLKCYTSGNIAIVFWGSHSVGDNNIQKIMSSTLPIIVDLNAIELEAPYSVQANLGAIISVPSDYAVKFVMHVV